MELSKDPYWHTLLHYKKTLLGFHSLVDDPRFFLALSGKYEPQAELEATLRGLFSPEGDEKQHPACRFVARYDWLADRLKIDRSRLPVPECRRFGEIMGEIKPAHPRAGKPLMDATVVWLIIALFYAPLHYLLPTLVVVMTGAEEGPRCQDSCRLQ